MNATDFAAWWGAIAATLAIVWDVIKWSRGGPVIKVNANPNMVLTGSPSVRANKEKYIFVEVTNTGDQKTTITHFASYYYESYWSYLRGKADQSFAVVVPAMGPGLPFGIAPGERWVGGMIQDAEIEGLSRTGRLCVGIYHSSANKPVLRRVIVHKKGDA